MEANYFTILYWFCHTSTCIRHGCTRVPHPEPPSCLPPHTIPLGHPSAPAPSILYPASNLDWRFISYIMLYMFQCHSPKSSYPHILVNGKTSELIKYLIMTSPDGDFRIWKLAFAGSQLRNGPHSGSARRFYSPKNTERKVPL